MTVRYDPKLVDDYIKHVTELSKKRRCIASQDIRSQFGVLLIKKGAEISPAIAARINSHTLQNAVDDCIEIENTLTDKKLHNLYLAWFADHPFLQAVQVANNFEQALYCHCMEQTTTSLLQKLTVLQEQFPAHFNESLFCAWFAGLLAFKQNQTSAAVGAAFCAGLYSRLGILHIPADVATHPAQDLAAYQTYPIIGFLILKNTAGMDKTAPKGVLEHAEKLLGEGFPRGQDLTTLSAPGLLTVLATTLLEMLQLMPEDHFGNLTIALPYLRVNYALAPHPTFSAALSAIVAARLPPFWQTLELKVEDYQPFLLHKALIGCQVNACLNVLFKSLREQTLSEQGQQLQNMLQRCQALLHATGVSSLDTIEALSMEPDAASLSLEEMMEFDLLQADFISVARQLAAKLHTLLPTESLTDDVKMMCQEQADLIHSILEELPAVTYLHMLKSHNIDE